MKNGAANPIPHLAENLYKRRLATGLAVAEFANLMGVTPGAVSMVETGRRLPSLDLLALWVAATGGGMVDLSGRMPEGVTVAFVPQVAAVAARSEAAARGALSAEIKAIAADCEEWENPEQHVVHVAGTPEAVALVLRALRATLPESVVAPAKKRWPQRPPRSALVEPPCASTAPG